MDTDAEKSFEYDVFISHASEDKDAFVRQFATKLQEWGLKVWYDEFSLQVGDSLSGSINKGLIKSKYGVIVLSNAFIRKKWPEYELRSLLVLQTSNSQRILPIWHDIDPQTITNYSPFLADVIALNTKDGLLAVAYKIVRVVRPDIAEVIHQYLRFQWVVQNSPIEHKKASEFVSSPRRRERLSDGQMRRVRTICMLLDGILLASVDHLYDSFLRDLHTEDELQIWEWIALVVYKYKARSSCSIGEAKCLLQALLFVNLAKMLEIMTNNLDKRAAWQAETGLNIDLLLNIIHETNIHPQLPDENSSHST